MPRRLNSSPLVICSRSKKKVSFLTILVSELGSTNEELELISVRYDEQQLSRVEIESKLHRKEAESKQMGLDLTDALAARKELTNQLTQLRDELSKQEKFVFKLEVGRKRLERDLDDLKGQLVSTGVDGQVKSLLDQIKRKDAQLEEVPSSLLYLKNNCPFFFFLSGRQTSSTAKSLRRS